MKHLMVMLAGIVIIFGASVFAVDGTSEVPAKADPSKAVTVKQPKETKVSIIGIVKDISDTHISVERTVRGETEIMEFVLDKAIEKVNVGDKVKVNYMKKDGKNRATRVTPVVVKKIIRKASPPRDTKPTPTETLPQK
ncbi:MAG TPA: hypothetical protein VFG29_10700 [Syntrophales bacterium]|nr:hypothetical protein [Syntrophales bacterium]